MFVGVLAQAVTGAQVLGGLPPMPGRAECTPDAESAGSRAHGHGPRLAAVELKENGEAVSGNDNLETSSDRNNPDPWTGVVVLCTPLMLTTACTTRENGMFMSGENYNDGEMPRRAYSTAAHYMLDRKESRSKVKVLYLSYSIQITSEGTLVAGGTEMKDFKSLGISAQSTIKKGGVIKNHNLLRIIKRHQALLRLLECSVENLLAEGGGGDTTDWLSAGVEAEKTGQISKQKKEGHMAGGSSGLGIGDKVSR
ncbi:hypothetical protein C8F04DRAFT_1187357 [Mycena alexandri]|uniref:Uncharacterized protein n=1 Tax=Mycena alexandri TaxID=1745969 RepID=A0AAD6SQ96_9AGAR|nr:hypothetical protein C8F04DRAFT_1187357 [Mycena alexandri]